MTQLPKIVRARLQAGEKPGAHPDADLLTAFAENSLPERERLSVLEHLSRCADCREVAALAQPEFAEQQIAVAAAASSPAPSRARWPGRLIFGWGTLAACAVIAVFLLRYQLWERPSAQLASRAPAPLNAEQNSPAVSSPALKDELAAKLEPPPASRLKTRDKNSGQAITTAAPMTKKAGATASTPAAGAMASAPPLPQTAEHEAAPSAADEIASGKPEPALQGGSRAAKATNQQAAAAPPPPVTQQENKPMAPSSSVPAAKTSGGLGSVAAFSHQKTNLETTRALALQKEAIQKEALQKESMARMDSNYIPTRWSISSDGSSLLRSTDEGKSWERVNVAQGVIFRAVAALGPEVWAGGKAGALLSLLRPRPALDSSPTVRQRHGAHCRDRKHRLQRYSAERNSTH